MYNAKEDNITNVYADNKLKYECICERMYFDMNQNDSMIRIKKSLAPIEDILDN